MLRLNQHVTFLARFWGFTNRQLVENVTFLVCFLESFKDAIGGSLRSELTSGVGWTKLLRFGLGFGRFSKRQLVVLCRMSRVPQDRGDKGWVEPVHCL